MLQFNPLTGSFELINFAQDNLHVLKAGDTMSGALNITASSVSSFTVGLNGTTSPSLQVDDSVGGTTAGILIKPNNTQTTNSIFLSAISGDTNTRFFLDGKGNGPLELNQNSTTGQIGVGPFLRVGNTSNLISGRYAMAVSGSISDVSSPGVIYAFNFGPTQTSTADGGFNVCFVVNGTQTSSSGKGANQDTWGAWWGPNMTIPANITWATAYSLGIYGPSISKGSGAHVTTAANIHLRNGPTQGDSNYTVYDTTTTAWYLQNGNFQIAVGGAVTIAGGGIAVTGNSTITGTLTSLTGITSSGTAALGTITATGKITKYNNVTTAGYGAGSIVAYGRITAQNAAATITSFTVGGSDGSFDISSNVNISLNGGTSSLNVSIAWTDENGTSQTMTQQMARVNGTITGTPMATTNAWASPAMRIHSQAACTITVSTTGTLSGSATYNAESTITQVA